MIALRLLPRELKGISKNLVLHSCLVLCLPIKSLLIYTISIIQTAAAFCKPDGNNDFCCIVHIILFFPGNTCMLPHLLSAHPTLTRPNPELDLPIIVPAGPISYHLKTILHSPTTRVFDFDDAPLLTRLADGRLMCDSGIQLSSYAFWANAPVVTYELIRKVRLLSETEDLRLVHLHQ